MSNNILAFHRGDDGLFSVAWAGGIPICVSATRDEAAAALRSGSDFPEVEIHNSDGNNGGDGGNTTFGSHLTANGGQGGRAGNNNAGTGGFGGTGGSGNVANGSNGGYGGVGGDVIAASSRSIGSDAPATTNSMAGGGGGGACGITASNQVATFGGLGGNSGSTRGTRSISNPGNFNESFASGTGSAPSSQGLCHLAGTTLKAWGGAGGGGGACIYANGSTNIIATLAPGLRPEIRRRGWWWRWSHQQQ